MRSQNNNFRTKTTHVGNYKGRLDFINSANFYFFNIQSGAFKSLTLSAFRVISDALFMIADSVHAAVFNMPRAHTMTQKDDITKKV